jgi:hypothetical protein
LGPVSPIENQLDQAAPDQMISAVDAALASAPGEPRRSGVFSVCDNARRRSFASNASIKAKGGSARSDRHLVLPGAQGRTRTDCAPSTRDVRQSLTIDPNRRPQLSHQSQTWDNIAYIGAKQVAVLRAH